MVDDFRAVDHTMHECTFTFLNYTRVFVTCTLYTVHCTDTYNIKKLSKKKK